MKIKFLTFAATLVLSQSVFAKLPQPQTCPSVGAFMDTGVTDVFQDSEGKWWGTLRSKFDTTALWDFYVGRFDAKSISDALGLANMAISTLEYKRGPDSEGLPDGMWLCIYEGKNAFAATLFGAGDQKISMIQQFFAK